MVNELRGQQPRGAAGANEGRLSARGTRAAGRGRAALLLATSSAIVVGAAAPMIVSSGHAAAEDTPASDRIVVTAERREQSVQEVPISVTVLDSDALARRAVDDIGDLQQVAPSIAINTVNRSTFVNIRGVGLAQTIPNSVPGVAFYIDGQLISKEQIIRHSFYDFNAVEILRGPQGTLNGLNSTGGAVYITTPQPDYEDSSGYLDATYGSFSRFKLVGAANVPVSENVAFRLAGVHEQKDSYVDNIGSSPSEPGSFDQNSVRANLALRTNDERFRFNLRGEYFDYESDHSPIKNRNDLVTSDPFVIEEDARAFLNHNGYRISGEARYDLTDAFEVRWLSAYEDVEARDQVDGDRTATAPPVPEGLPITRANRSMYPGRVTFSGTDFETVMHEINFISTGDGPFQWVLGAFSLHEKFPVFVWRDHRNTDDFYETSNALEAAADNTSFAVFGQATYFVSPQWELLLGLRYNWDDQEYTRITIPGPPPPPDQRVGLQDSEQMTGKVGVNYFPNDDAMLYLTVSQGYKAGGANLSLNLPNFGPETNLVYETGFKLSGFENRTTLNGAVFFSDYQGIQLSSTKVLPPGIPTPVQQNAGDSEIFGGELELFTQLGDLAINGGVSYLKGEFAESTCINNNLNPAGDPRCTDSNDFVPEGRVLPFAPKWTFNVGAEYVFDLGGDMWLTPRVQVSHTSEQYTTPFPAPETLLDERNILDARITLDVGERFTLEAYGTNLLDETYIASQVHNSSSADGGIVYGLPEEFGVRAVARY